MFQKILAAGILEIESNRLLTRILREERYAHPPIVELGITTQPTCKITSACRLDLNDFGTEVGKLMAAERAGQYIGQVENPNLLERSHGDTFMSIIPRDSLLRRATYASKIEFYSVR